MLDEEEYKSVQDAYSVGALEVKRLRTIEGRSLRESDEEVLYGGVATRYREITGGSNVPYQEILKHRLSLLGHPCEKCGKELRTPLAKKCVECGHMRDSTVAGGPSAGDEK
jgi:hypothetical protein